MSSGFKDLREFRDPDLILPIGGKEYRIKSPSALEGLRIRQLFAAGVLGDESELEEIAKILGATWVPNIRKVRDMNPITGEPRLDDNGNPVVVEADFGRYEGGVWSQMDDDGVTWDEIMHAGRTALIDIGMGRLVAEAQWMIGATESGDQGNPLPPKPGGNRKQRRKKNKKSKASTARTTRGPEPTGPTTPAAENQTPIPESEPGTTSQPSPNPSGDESDGPTSSKSGTRSS